MNHILDPQACFYQRRTFETNNIDVPLFTHVEYAGNIPYKTDFLKTYMRVDAFPIHKYISIYVTFHDILTVRCFVRPMGCKGSKKEPSGPST